MSADCVAEAEMTDAVAVVSVMEMTHVAVFKAADTPVRYVSKLLVPLLLDTTRTVSRVLDEMNVAVAVAIS